jgi:hypothetical protein
MDPQQQQEKAKQFIEQNRDFINNNEKLGFQPAKQETVKNIIKFFDAPLLDIG